MFKVDNGEKAKQVIVSSMLDITIESSNNIDLFINISQEKIPVLNKLLCDNGINVFSIEAKRKLEDYFLKLINA